MKKAFSNSKYLSAQKAAILNRFSKFEKLYFEIGGHLLYDGHASRVLPGYNPENKLKLMKSFGKDLGVVYCVSAKALENNNTWSDSGLSPRKLALKEIRLLRKKGINVLGVAINLFNGEKKAIEFKKELEKKHEKVIITSIIKGYPFDLTKVFGKFGFEAQPFFETKEKIIAVTGLGANNGKMFFCLNEVYHCEKQGIDAGYAKLETFPIWNTKPAHEVNKAYEAATADIQDIVLLDPFYSKATGKEATNYNRDIEGFPVLKKLINRVTKKTNYMHTYNSPTDMGLNMAKTGIINDSMVKEASQQEILRRYEQYEKTLNGTEKEKTLKRMREIILSVPWPN